MKRLSQLYLTDQQVQCNTAYAVPLGAFVSGRVLLNGDRKGRGKGVGGKRKRQHDNDKQTTKKRKK